MTENLKEEKNIIELGRASKEYILKQNELIKNIEYLSIFLEKIPSITLIINQYRQIIYMNKVALEFSKIDEISEVLGKRPGEAMDCIHSYETEGGCGTTEACSYCGALNVILKSQDGVSAVEDGRFILGKKKNAFDLRIWSSPFIFENNQFYLVTIQDIKHEKRTAIYERIFFHDLLNTITGLNLNIQMLRKENIAKKKIIFERLEYFIKHLVDEIRSQQIINAAEVNKLLLKYEKINTLELLKEILDLYEYPIQSNNKKIQVDIESANITFNSDISLLRRIIKNMVINAIEATSENELITIGANIDNQNVIFYVNNPGFISKDIQLQLFQRSFSTKGFNRGLGTYSMKLLSSFLNAEVDFKTSKQEGTTFYLIIPLGQRDK
ncbi:MAG: HAMP domain-containing histidine kinase [Candidatus Lokiarchaeota archaeon]|nr:HAMP domain-containing histidine kinase [Candidatus Lokiarchaeota archaeon]